MDLSKAFNTINLELFLAERMAMVSVNTGLELHITTDKIIKKESKLKMCLDPEKIRHNATSKVHCLVLHCPIFT